jgi:phosphate transport system substrate-binding protein
MMDCRIKKISYMSFALGGLLLVSCNPPSKDAHTITTGRMSIVGDETFEPIIEDELAVFQHTYIHTEIKLISKPEKNAVMHLLEDSAKVAILARRLTDEETQFFESKQIIPKTTRFAIDGIALIANKNYPDSVITAKEVIQTLKGRPSTIETMVFDNPLSSTLRYMLELSQVKNMPTKGIYSLQSNADVIKYVHDNPRAIGVIGVNWMAQPDPELEEYTKKLKILAVKNQTGLPGDDGYYHPSQNNLALGKYAFSRDLFIINCQGVQGLGVGFAAFLAGERGQRIILKSGLLPDSIPPREINIIH